MIDLYFSPTPNGLKIRLFLEEAGLAYRLHPVRLTAGEQFAADFVAISPNAKIPAIVDSAPPDQTGPLPVFESGAILLHLAETSGKLLSTDARERMETLQWLFWQTSGLGPMAGQAGYFRVYAPTPVPVAIERYTRELRRLYGVLDRRLEGRDYIAGNAYSIADVACYPWIVPHAGHGQVLADFPNLARWFHAIAARPATQRIYAPVEDVYAVRGQPVAVDATA
jgi:GST-like protein